MEVKIIRLIFVLSEGDNTFKKQQKLFQKKLLKNLEVQNRRRIFVITK